MTVRENLLPSAMVPGLVTIKGKNGKTQNVYPVDAKELIASGEYELVDNGAIEAARLAATPLRSGAAAGIPDDMIVAEVTGIEGRVVTAGDAKEAQALKDAGDSEEAKPSTGEERTSGATAMREAISEADRAGRDAPAPTKVPSAADKKPAEGSGSKAPDNK